MAIESAVDRIIEGDMLTKDLGGSASTQAFAKAVAAELR